MMHAWQAEPLYKEAVIGFSKGLGQYHPTPLSYQHELTRLLLDMGKAQEAEDKASETVKGLRAVPVLRLQPRTSSPGLAAQD